jgi:hypothetical protein
MLRAVSRKAQLLLLGILVGLTVQTGTLRSLDTVRRLQWARSLWTSAPEVVDVWPAAGLVDRSGGLHAWWDVGQSLSFVPFDMLSVAVARAAGLPSASGGRVQRAVVGATYYPLFTGLCLAAAYWWLIGIGLSDSSATFGTLGLLFGSTLFYWTHGAQENSLMLLCALVASGGAAYFARTGRLRFAAISMAGLGYTALIRPQIFGVTGIGAAISLVAFHQDVRRLSRDVIRRAALIAAITLIAFVVIERVVHYSRFHEWHGWYMGYLGPYIAAHPEYPPNWPLSLPFVDGLIGQTWSRFSVFFFEPLLALPVLIWLFRKPVARPAVVVMIGLLVSLLVEIVAYARIDFWYGSNSWGPRYLTVPCEMCAALAVAVVASMWRALSRVERLAAGALIAFAVAIQLSSILLDDSLELVQDVAGRPVVVQRFVNLWHFFSTRDVSSLGWRLYPSGTPHITLFPWLGGLYLGSTYGTMALVVWLGLVVATLWTTAKVVRSAVTR